MESQANTIFKSLVSRALKKKEITPYMYVLKNWIDEIFIAYKLERKKRYGHGQPKSIK